MKGTFGEDTELTEPSEQATTSKQATHQITTPYTNWKQQASHQPEQEHTYSI
jgi:hypothetical protein